MHHRKLMISFDRLKSLTTNLVSVGERRPGRFRDYLLRHFFICVGRTQHSGFSFPIRCLGRGRTQLVRAGAPMIWIMNELTTLPHHSHRRFFLHATSTNHYNTKHHTDESHQYRLRMAWRHAVALHTKCGQRFAEQVRPWVRFCQSSYLEPMVGLAHIVANLATGAGSVRRRRFIRRNT